MKKILSFALVLMTVLALMIPAFASAEEPLLRLCAGEVPGQPEARQI